MPTLPFWWLDEGRAWEGDAPDAPRLDGEHEADVANVAPVAPNVVFQRRRAAKGA